MEVNKAFPSAETTRKLPEISRSLERGGSWNFRSKRCPIKTWRAGDNITTCLSSLSRPTFLLYPPPYLNASPEKPSNSHRRLYRLSEHCFFDKLTDIAKSFNAGTIITLKKSFFCPDKGEGIRLLIKFSRQGTGLLERDLTFEAELPPLPHHVQQKLMISAEDLGGYFWTSLTALCRLKSRSIF